MIKENLIRINIDSDFEIIDVVPYANVPFKYVYFVGDDMEHTATIQYDGNIYSGCTPIEGMQDKIAVYFNGNNFPTGNLRVRREFLLESANFEDGVENLVVINHTNIYITKCDGLNWASVYVDTDLPNFDAYTMTYRVEQSLIQINDKIDEVNQVLNDIEQVSDSVEDTLKTLSGYDETLDDIKQWVDGFTELEPAFNSSVAATITQQDIDNWNDGINRLPDDVVTTDRLNEYVKVSNMLTALQQYVRKDTLNDYYQKTEIVDILDRYVTNNKLLQALSDYVSNSNLSNTLNNYVTNNKLQNYYTKNETDSLLSQFIDSTVLNETLKSYVTKINMTSTLKDYMLKSDMNGYATKDFVNAQRFATESWVENKIAGIRVPSMDKYVSWQELHNMNYLTVDELQDNGLLNINLNGYVKTDDIQSKIINDYHLVTTENISNYIDLTGYAKTIDIRNWVIGQGYLTTETEPQFNSSAASLITPAMIANWENSASKPPIDLSGYALKSEIPNVSGYALKSELPNLSGYALKSELPNLSGYAKLTDIPSIANCVKYNDLVHYITWEGLNTELDDYATKEYVLNKVSGVDIDLTGYATQNWVINEISKINVNDVDLSAYALKSEIPNVSDYYKKKEIDDKIAVLSARIPSIANYITKTDADARYALKSDTYTKAQVDALVGNGSGGYVNPFILITQAEYDSLSVKQNDKMYIITDSQKTVTYDKSEIDNMFGDVSDVLNKILNS